MVARDNSPDMGHLHPSALDLLEAPDKERIKFILSPKWITYPKAAEGLELLEELWEHPPHHRMPCAMIWGETNNGKTMLSLRFVRKHPPNDNPDGEHANIPVFAVQMPFEPTPKDFLTEVLRRGFAHYKERDSVPTLRTNVINHLRVCQTRVLVIDEFHNVLGVSGTQQRTFFRLIRYLTNDLKIPIVCFGTKEALLPFRNDEQLSNRFRRFELPNWAYNKECARYLNSLERLLPLRKKSNLAQPLLAKKIISSAKYTIGEMTDYVKFAAIQAIKDGTETIDEACLDRCSYIPPDDKRRRPPPPGRR